MQIKDLIPWTRKGPDVRAKIGEDNPILGLQREMNRVFDSFWNRFDRPSAAANGALAQGLPRTDVVETDDAVELSIEVPGLDEKEIEVSLSGDVLTIKGEKTSEQEGRRKGYYLSERSYGSFYRSVPLPPGVAADDAKADLRNGVLTVSLRKTPEAQAKLKKIEVKAV